MTPEEREDRARRARLLRQVIERQAPPPSAWRFVGLCLLTFLVGFAIAWCLS